MVEFATAISVIAALVAASSALYARWEAKAAQRANEISLHESRLRVYNGLVRFRTHISARGTSINEEEVWRFAEVAELSEFYFPHELAVRLSAVFESALRVLSMHEEWQAIQQVDKEKIQTIVLPMHELMRSARDECYLIGNDLKSHLRVGAA